MVTHLTDDYQTASICLEIKTNIQLLAIAQRCKNYGEFKLALSEEHARAIRTRTLLGFARTTTGQQERLRPTFFTHTTNGVSYFALNLNVKRLDELIASL